MQAHGLGCSNSQTFTTRVSRPCQQRCALRIQAGALPAAAEAGNNVLGEGIRRTYGIGSDTTIRWGVLKAKVQPPPDKNGREQTWQQYRKATEKNRQQLRKEFAEKLEVIAEPERKRRLAVGIVMGAFTVALGAWLLSNGAGIGQRLWITPTLFFSLGFIDSSIQGLCTESWAGAWDVDDTGLEYMPSKDLAERIQQKVLNLYKRDGLISTGLLAAFCLLPSIA